MADLLLHYGETYLLKPLVYPASMDDRLPPHDWRRQCLSLFLTTWIGAYLLYFSLAGLSYVFIFDKRVLQDKRLLPRQVLREIWCTVSSAPGMALLTIPVFMGELHGYSKLYDNVSDYGWAYLIVSIGLFLFFTDMLIYFIHRGLHDIKFMYKYVHKPHHKWIVTTPFASHAFHPVDGYLQGLPYHIFVFLFPFHKLTYLVMFVIVNLWTVSIHDCEYRVPRLLEGIINGAGHHTTHHTGFNYNYGQYFTLWDRLCGSYKDPDLTWKESIVAKSAPSPSSFPPSSPVRNGKAKNKSKRL